MQKTNADLRMHASVFLTEALAIKGNPVFDL